MAQLAIPVKGNTLYATGDVMLSIWVDLMVRDGSGAWLKREFCVDR